MTETEQAIIEAAIDLHWAQSGVDCGELPDRRIREEYVNLMRAIENHATENDGRLPISEVSS